MSSRYGTNIAIGRPIKRWEDDINEFFKQEFEESENPIESSNKTNKTWINIAKDRRRLDLLEEIYTMTVWERQKLKTNIQPTSQNQRENEMMTTGNAAAPQPRFASINRMMHSKAAADLHSRTSWWVDVWWSRTLWRVLYKGWRYWVRLPRTEARKIGWETGVIAELRYLPTSSSGVCFFLVSLACSSPLGFLDFFSPEIWIREFIPATACLSLRFFFFLVHLVIWCSAHWP